MLGAPCPIAGAGGGLLMSLEPYTLNCKLYNPLSRAPRAGARTSPATRLPWLHIEDLGSPHLTRQLQTTLQTLLGAVRASVQKSCYLITTGSGFAFYGTP